MDVDAKRLRRLFDGDALSPRWSPDGRSIAFLGGRDGAFGAFVVDLATGHARYAGASSSAQVRWSPDGRQLLLRAPDSPSGAGGLTTVDVATGVVRRLHADGLYADWAPDGQRISFGGPACRDGQLLRVYDLRSDATVSLVRLYPDASVFLSPDWARVAYFRDRIFYNDAEPDPTLYVSDPGGSNERALFTPPDRARPMIPVWSPDGAWIVYATRSAGGMYLPRADGSEGPITLVPPGEFGEAGGWSADSTRLLVLAGTGGYRYDVRDSTKTAVRASGTLSPDGTRVASIAGSVTLTDISMGVTSVAPTDPWILASDAQWSPDSTAVAFIGASGPKDYGPCI